MNGVDAIVFTAGIGENADDLRSEIISRLNFMGIKMNEEQNKQRDDEMIISTDDSAVKVLKVATDEEIMIARDVELLKNNK